MSNTFLILSFLHSLGLLRDFWRIHNVWILWLVSFSYIYVFNKKHIFAWKSLIRSSIKVSNVIKELYASFNSILKTTI